MISVRLYFCIFPYTESNGTPLQYSCLENPRDGGAWWAVVYGVAQSRTRLKRLSNEERGASQVALVVKNPPANAGDVRDGVRSLDQENPLEEGTATHSSILAWRIPWTEKPGRLQPMGSQKVRHDLRD